MQISNSKYRIGQLVRYTKENMRKSYGEIGLLVHHYYIPHPDGGFISTWHMLIGKKIKMAYEEEIEEINV